MQGAGGPSRAAEIGAATRTRLRRVGLLVSSVIAALLAAPPTALAQSFPGWVNSHYMSPVTSSYMWDRGCDVGGGTKYQGGGITDYVVVLDFMQPYVSGGVYGARMSGTFENTSWIADKVEQFGLGFYDCSSSVPRLNIIAGVNSDSSTVTSAHGTAWANMVTTIDNWFSTSPHDIVSQVWAHGGIDAESGFYASPSMLRSWVNAYSSAAGTVSYAYDFGDAAGCAYDTYKAPPGYTCNNGFTQDDYFYLSYGCANCQGLPEIYNTTIKTLPNGNPTDPNAQEWEGIRLYGYHELGQTNEIDGSTTQHTACGQPGHSCSGTNNTAQAGWTHLYNVVTYFTPVQSFGLPWSNDFMWGW